MMLNNIGFSGFSVKSSKFQINDISEQGTFKVLFSEIEIEIIEPDEDHKQQIVMTFEAGLVGHTDGVDAEDTDAEPAFEAEFLIETTFIDLNDKAMSETDIKENIWFFENFNQISTKIASDNIFKNTEISYMPIPWTGKGAVSSD